MSLIPQNVLVRGAVTIGDSVQSWGRVYGRAIVRAYDLERVPGEPARIVVDEEALTSIRPAIEREGLGSELRSLVKEEGSRAYLDYLRACEGELNVPEQEYPIFLKLHRDLIRNGLSVCRTPGSFRKISMAQGISRAHSPRAIRGRYRNICECSERPICPSQAETENQAYVISIVSI
jgi:hypothetical protein